jgi:hypothetical protein
MASSVTSACQRPQLLPAVPRLADHPTAARSLLGRTHSERHRQVPQRDVRDLACPASPHGASLTDHGGEGPAEMKVWGNWGSEQSVRTMARFGQSMCSRTQIVGERWLAGRHGCHDLLLRVNARGDRDTEQSGSARLSKALSGRMTAPACAFGHEPLSLILVVAGYVLGAASVLGSQE